jgi:hypothetical protein
MPSTYHPGHRAHFALAFLEQQTADLGELTRVLDAMSPTSRNKAYWIMEALIEDDFVSLAAGDYRLTEHGAATLARLRAGEIVDTRPVQSVRIFAREAAA